MFNHTNIMQRINLNKFSLVSWKQEKYILLIASTSRIELRKDYVTAGK